MKPDVTPAPEDEDGATGPLTLPPPKRRWHQRIRHHFSPKMLAALAFVTAAIWLFVELAEEIMAGDTLAFDSAILLAFRDPADPGHHIGPEWLETVMRDLTALGGVTVLGLLVAAVVGLLWFQSRHRTALMLLIAVGGGQLFSNVAKFLFDRPRPDLVPHGTLVTTASFPSGHSMMSAVIWLTLAGMVARTEPSLSMRIYLISIATLITFLVGVSRIYLGVHWPTDVVAGWAAGATWALTCTALARVIDPLPERPAP